MPESGDNTDYPYASVALNLPFMRQFDYYIPQQLRGNVLVGGRVRVPFGHQKSLLGYCVGLKMETDVPAPKLRSVKESLDTPDEAGPVFSPKMLKLGHWMADYYHCGLGEALAAAIPSAVHAGSKKRRRVQCIRLATDRETAWRKAKDIFDRSPAQSKILRTLAAMDEAPSFTELKSAAGTAGRSSVKALRAKGLVEIGRKTVELSDELEQVKARTEAPLPLTRQQQHAYDVILRSIRNRKFGVMLLHGVTSSGKTEVYLQVIREVVDRGAQAIVLVPEISLTPQTVRHFRSRFRRLAVLHSRLTERQRRRYWHRIRAGEADVVIGARSAIFAPTPNLGVLVIDEEHENSFKQDSVPRYHARDVGIMRAKFDNAPVILGTATPSLESYRNSKTNKYKMIRMGTRIGNRPMPPVDIVDMRHEWSASGGTGVISRRLRQCMAASLDGGRQVILFLNRRGFSPYIKCPRCGFDVQCSRCEITMNYHRNIGVLQCHYCGLEKRPPGVCPECGGKNIRFSGVGTEKVEGEVRRLFPDVRVLRMDSDTMKTRDAHERTLKRFGEGEAAVLVGTQMIAKGLDFAGVTTVGVINSDVSLHMPDFRSRERTFQLLAQVAGRTGRGPAGGRVVFQTYLPDDPAIRAAAMHNYEEFAEEELAMRRRLGYPPYGRMVRIICRGPKQQQVRDYMDGLGRELRGLCRGQGGKPVVLGPAPAPVAKIKHRHRMHIIVKAADSATIHSLLQSVTDLNGPSGAKVIVDIDPLSMV